MIAQGVVHRIQIGGKCSGHRNQQTTLERQRDPARVTVEQPRPELGFETGNHLAERRLGHVEALRRQFELFTLRQGKKRSQQAAGEVIQIFHTNVPKD